MQTDLMDLGIKLIIMLQNLGAWLEAPMKFFSFLGQEEFFLFIMPVLYWSIDASLGLRIGLMLMFSNAVNSALKLAFHSPRPFYYTDEVRALAVETSFGIPSGHAQNAAAMWGLLAASLKKRWVTALMVLLIFLIGLSRLYLGVHFPTDVLVGWAIGGLLVWAFVRFEEPVKSWLKSRPLSAQSGAIFTVSGLMILAVVLIRMSLGAWTVPQVWLNNAAQAFPTGPAPDPLNLEGIFTVSGAFFGLALGAAYLYSRHGFHTGGSGMQRFLRFAIGLVGVMALRFGLGAIFPEGESVLALSLRYLRYTLIGLWISALAPILFFRFGLAVPEKQIQDLKEQDWRTNPAD